MESCCYSLTFRTSGVLRIECQDETQPMNLLIKLLKQGSEGGADVLGLPHLTKVSSQHHLSHSTFPLGFFIPTKWEDITHHQPVDKSHLKTRTVICFSWKKEMLKCILTRWVLYCETFPGKTCFFLKIKYGWELIIKWYFLFGISKGGVSECFMLTHCDLSGFDTYASF